MNNTEFHSQIHSIIEVSPERFFALYGANFQQYLKETLKASLKESGFDVSDISALRDDTWDENHRE